MEQTMLSLYRLLRYAIYWKLRVRSDLPFSTFQQQHWDRSEAQNFSSYHLIASTLNMDPVIEESGRRCALKDVWNHYLFRTFFDSLSGVPNFAAVYPEMDCKLL